MEDTFLKENFDLVIGNPPFGDTRLLDRHRQDLTRLSPNIHSYFFARGLDSLNPGGLALMVVSRYLMDADRPDNRAFRLHMHNQAELLGVIRLPNSTFEKTAFTQVVTDVIVLRKRHEPLHLSYEKPTVKEVENWQKTEKTRIQAEYARKATEEELIYPMPDGFPDWIRGKAVIGYGPDASGKNQDVPILGNPWFLTHPDHILGTLSIGWGSGLYRSGAPIVFEDRNRFPDLGQALTETLKQCIPARILNALKRVEPLSRHPYPEISTEAMGTHVTPFSSFIVPEAVREAALEAWKKREGYALKTDFSEVVKVPAPLPRGPQQGLFRQDSSLPLIGRRLPDDIVIEQMEKIRKPRWELVTFTASRVHRQAQRMAGMIALRDTLLDLTALQRTETARNTAEMTTLRQRLKQDYHTFVKKFGHLNSAENERIMRFDPFWAPLSSLEIEYDKGVSRDMARRYGIPHRKPDAVLSEIFVKRTQFPIQPVTHADTAQDALLICLSEQGRVDPQRIMQLTGKSWENVEQELRVGEDDALIFEVAEGVWEERSQWLSGNVVKKLQTLEAAQAKSNQPEKYAKSLEILRRHQPERIDITTRKIHFGAVWLPESVIENFLQTLDSQASITCTKNPVTTEWSLKGDSHSVEYGTDHLSMVEIVHALLNKKPIEVKYKEDNGQYFVDQEATSLAVQKSEKILTAWQAWIFADRDRVQILEERYNQLMNTHVERKYDGQHLAFPGMNPAIHMRPHQKNVIWRCLQSPTNSTLIDHVVGSGKTFSGAAAVMEMVRTGQARKPLVTVPNHLVRQWANDWLLLYPGARILVAGEHDMEKGHRQHFLAKAAFNEVDAVIMAQSSFDKIPVDATFYEAYLQKEIDIAEAYLRHCEDNKDDSVKKMEKKVESLRAKITKLHETANQARDDGCMNFNEVGFDLLMVDESHNYKNVPYFTGLQNVRGLGNPEGSQKAENMMIKVSNCRTAGAGVIFMTGTPISNTVAEMYLLQKYLNPEALEEKNIRSFDAWVSLFAEVQEDFAFTLTGTFKPVRTLGRFDNLPELVGMYREYADVINQKDIARLLKEQGKRALPMPKIKNGKATVVTCPMTPAQRRYIGEEVGYNDLTGEPEYAEGSILHRLDNLPKGKPEPGADNILVIINDLRKVGLDARVFDPSYQPDEGEPTGKLGVCAESVKKIYDQWDADKGTQLVFLDFSTPLKNKSRKEQSAIDQKIAILVAGEAENASATQKQQAESALESLLQKYTPDEIAQEKRRFLAGGEEIQAFSAYEELRRLMVADGIPVEEIAFIHDADTPEKKETLFEDVRQGKIRVLLGSTAKMGPGMNVQDRLVAVHHLDAPYRPTDVEQRNGRILRQGNKLLKKYGKLEVDIRYYVTENSSDAGLWQILETKKQFIDQVRYFDGKSLSVVDPDAQSMDPASIKAAASGHEVLMLEVPLRMRQKKLKSLKNGFQEEQRRHAFRADDARQNLKNLENSVIPFLNAAETAAQKLKTVLDQGIKANKNIPADQRKAFIPIDVHGDQYITAERLAVLCERAHEKMRLFADSSERIAIIGGMPLDMVREDFTRCVLRLSLPDTHHHLLSLYSNDFGFKNSIKWMTRLTGMLKQMDFRERTVANRAELQADIDRFDPDARFSEEQRLQALTAQHQVAYRLLRLKLRRLDDLKTRLTGIFLEGMKKEKVEVPYPAEELADLSLKEGDSAPLKTVWQHTAAQEQDAQDQAEALYAEVVRTFSMPPLTQNALDVLEKIGVSARQIEKLKTEFVVEADAENPHASMTDDPDEEPEEAVPAVEETDIEQKVPVDDAVIIQTRQRIGLRESEQTENANPWVAQKSSAPFFTDFQPEKVVQGNLFDDLFADLDSPGPGPGLADGSPADGESLEDSKSPADSKSPENDKPLAENRIPESASAPAASVSKPETAMTAPDGGVTPLESAMPENLKAFLPASQWEATQSALNGEEGAFFREKMQELSRMMNTMPRTYQTDGKDDRDVTVFLHYFANGLDVYVTELDKDTDGEGQRQAFGIVDLHNGLAEMGYIDLKTILETRPDVNLDYHYRMPSLLELKLSQYPDMFINGPRTVPEQSGQAPVADTVPKSLFVPESLNALVTQEQRQQWEDLWESGTETDRDLLRLQMNRVAHWLDAPLPVTEAERQGRDARAGIVLRSEQGGIHWFITGLNADGVSAYGMQIVDEDAILGRVDLRVALRDAPILVTGHEPGPLLADLRAAGILMESVDFADDTRTVFYRGGPVANISGISSIESIFDYERDRLENDAVTMTPEGLAYQHLAPVNTLTWASTSREEAEEYGAAREIILNDPVELMRDGQGGVLVAERKDLENALRKASPSHDVITKESEIPLGLKEIATMDDTCQRAVQDIREDGGWEAVQDSVALQDRQQDALDHIIHARAQSVAHALMDQGWERSGAAGFQHPEFPDIRIVGNGTTSRSGGNMVQWGYRLIMNRGQNRWTGTNIPDDFHEKAETFAQRLIENAVEMADRMNSDLSGVSNEQTAANEHKHPGDLQDTNKPEASASSATPLQQTMEQRVELDAYIVRHIHDHAPLVAQQAKANTLDQFLMGDILKATSDAILEAIEDQTLPRELRDAAKAVLQDPQGMTDYRRHIGQAFFNAVENDQTPQMTTPAPLEAEKSDLPSRAEQLVADVQEAGQRDKNPPETAQNPIIFLQKGFEKAGLINIAVDRGENFDHTPKHVAYVRGYTKDHAEAYVEAVAKMSDAEHGIINEITLRKFPERSLEAIYPLFKALEQADLLPYVSNVQAKFEASGDSAVQIERSTLFNDQDIQRVMTLGGRQSLRILLTMPLHADTQNASELQSARTLIEEWRGNTGLPVAVTAFVDRNGDWQQDLQAYLQPLGADYLDTVTERSFRRYSSPNDLIRDYDITMVLNGEMAALKVGRSANRDRRRNDDLKKPLYLIGTFTVETFYEADSRSRLLPDLEARKRFNDALNLTDDAPVAEMAEINRETDSDITMVGQGDVSTADAPAHPENATEESEIPDDEDAEFTPLSASEKPELPGWKVNPPDMLSPLWDQQIPATWPNEHGVFPPAYRAEWASGKNYFNKVEIAIARDPQGRYRFSTSGAGSSYLPGMDSPAFATFLEAHTAAREEVAEKLRRHYASPSAERGFVQIAPKLLEGVTRNADGDSHHLAEADALLQQPPYQQDFREILEHLTGNQRMVLFWSHWNERNPRSTWMVTLHRDADEQAVVAELRESDQWDFEQVPEYAQVVDAGNPDAWMDFIRRIADRFPDADHDALFNAPYGLHQEPVWHFTEPLPSREIPDQPPAPRWPEDLDHDDLPVESPDTLKNFDRYVGLRFEDEKSHVALLIARDKAGYVPAISYRAKNMSGLSSPNAGNTHYPTFAAAYAQGIRMLKAQLKEQQKMGWSSGADLAAKDWLDKKAGCVEPTYFGFDAARTETIWTLQDRLEGVTALQLRRKTPFRLSGDGSPDDYLLEGVVPGELRPRYINSVQSFDRALLMVNTTFARMSHASPALEQENPASALSGATLDEKLSATRLDAMFGSDAALGVRFVDHQGNEIPMTKDADGQSVFPDDSSAISCTNYAEQVKKHLPDHAVQIVGFAIEENPDCAVVREGWHPGGHDFAIVDHRWLVDPWARLVSGMRDQIIYDLLDSEDAQKVANTYGDPLEWRLSGTSSIGHESGLDRWDRTGLDAVIDAHESIRRKTVGITITEAAIIPTRAGVVAIPDDPENPVYLAGAGEISAADTAMPAEDAEQAEAPMPTQAESVYIVPNTQKTVEILRPRSGPPVLASVAVNPADTPTVIDADQPLSGVFNGLDETHRFIRLDEQWLRHPLIENWLQSGLFSRGGFQSRHDLLTEISGLRGKEIALTPGISDGELLRGEKFIEVINVTDNKTVSRVFESFLKAKQKQYQIALQDAQVLLDHGAFTDMDLRQGGDFAPSVNGRFVLDSEYAFHVHMEYFIETDPPASKRHMEAFVAGSDHQPVLRLEKLPKEADLSEWLSAAKTHFSTWRQDAQKVMQMIQDEKDLYQKSAETSLERMQAVPTDQIGDTDALMDYRDQLNAIDKMALENISQIESARNVLDNTLSATGVRIASKLFYEARNSEQFDAWRNTSREMQNLLKAAEDQVKRNCMETGRENLKNLSGTEPPEAVGRWIFMKHGISVKDDFIPHIVTDIQAKNIDRIQSSIGHNSQNPASQEIFEVMTRIKLAKTQKKRAAQIDAWAGISPETRQRMDADKKALREARQRIQEIVRIWERFGRLRATDRRTGKESSVQDMIWGMVQDGYGIIQLRESKNHLGRMVADPALCESGETDYGKYVTDKDFKKLLKALVAGNFDPEHRFLESMQNMRDTAIAVHGLDMQDIVIPVAPSQEQPSAVEPSPTDTAKNTPAEDAWNALLEQVQRAASVKNPQNMDRAHIAASLQHLDIPAGANPYTASADYARIWIQENPQASVQVWAVSRQDMVDHHTEMRDLRFYNGDPETRHVFLVIGDHSLIDPWMAKERPDRDALLDLEKSVDRDTIFDRYRPPETWIAPDNAQHLSPGLKKLATWNPDTQTFQSAPSGLADSNSLADGPADSNSPAIVNSPTGSNGPVDNDRPAVRDFPATEEPAASSAAEKTLPVDAPLAAPQEQEDHTMNDHLKKLLDQKTDLPEIQGILSALEDPDSPVQWAGAAQHWLQHADLDTLPRRIQEQTQDWNLNQHMELLHDVAMQTTGSPFRMDFSKDSLPTPDAQVATILLAAWLVNADLWHRLFPRDALPEKIETQEMHDVLIPYRPPRKPTEAQPMMDTLLPEPMEPPAHPVPDTAPSSVAAQPDRQIGPEDRVVKISIIPLNAELQAMTVWPGSDPANIKRWKLVAVLQDGWEIPAVLRPGATYDQVLAAAQKRLEKWPGATLDDQFAHPVPRQTLEQQVAADIDGIRKDAVQQTPMPQAAGAIPAGPAPSAGQMPSAGPSAGQKPDEKTTEGVETSALAARSWWSQPMTGAMTMREEQAMTQINQYLSDPQRLTEDHKRQWIARAIDVADKKMAAMQPYLQRDPLLAQAWQEKDLVGERIHQTMTVNLGNIFTALNDPEKAARKMLLGLIPQEHRTEEIRAIVLRQSMVQMILQKMGMEPFHSMLEIINQPRNSGPLLDLRPPLLLYGADGAHILLLNTPLKIAAQDSQENVAKVHAAKSLIQGKMAELYPKPFPIHMHIAYFDLARQDVLIRNVAEIPGYADSIRKHAETLQGMVISGQLPQKRVQIESNPVPLTPEITRDVQSIARLKAMETALQEQAQLLQKDFGQRMGSRPEDWPHISKSDSLGSIRTEWSSIDTEKAVDHLSELGIALSEVQQHHYDMDALFRALEQAGISRSQFVIESTLDPHKLETVLNTYGVPHHAYASARPIVTPETSHPEFARMKKEIERSLADGSLADGSLAGGNPAAPVEHPDAPAQPDAPVQPEKSGVATFGM
ncbi:Eco57I restriction-modification methylase domain-containing protein [Acidithiobacillus thiooxidans]|uniref:Eco57I restriction-modification methylase domain-containing protein n=2 Tax=Acidithiobacillus thiooxidans TaxID=930 RepID=UPI003563634E